MCPRLAVSGAAPILGAVCVLGQAGREATTPETHAMHRIVFELTADGPEQWHGLLNNVENVRKALGAEDTQVEVVLHARGIGLVLAAAGDEELRGRVRSLAGQGVVFAACANTMKKRHLRPEDLVAEAVVVDSGVAQVVRRQEQGWSYIKAGH